MNCSLAFVNLSLQNVFTMSNDFVSGFFTFLASTASSIIEKAPTVQKLCKVDVLNQENQKSYNQIDVGFAVELELKEVIGKMYFWTIGTLDKRQSSHSFIGQLGSVY
jgi:hypothetical protein